MTWLWVFQKTVTASDRTTLTAPAQVLRAGAFFIQGSFASNAATRAFSSFTALSNA